MTDKQMQAEKTAAAHRKIQAEVDAKPKPPEKEEAPQTGARKYRVPPFAKQHQPKPGSEEDLNRQPRYDAPFYNGSGKLEGKVAIVTGGDSGIGRSIAVLYAREGAEVAIIYHAEQTRLAIADEGKEALLISGDIKSRQFCKEAFAEVLKKFGRLDVLVNNAAFQLHVDKFEDLTEEHFDRTLKTNLYGMFHMCQEAVPHMRSGAAIVNNGSITGYRGTRRCSITR